MLCTEMVFLMKNYGRAIHRINLINPLFIEIQEWKEDQNSDIQQNEFLIYCEN